MLAKRATRRGNRPEASTYTDTEPRLITRIREKRKKGITTLNQTNRNNCSCTDRARCDSCSFGRTPWGTREGCSRRSCSWSRRPWNTENGCAARSANRSSCSCAANTTWTCRTGTCSCGAVPADTCSYSREQETRSGGLCASARDTEADCDCNQGARSSGLLDGKSLAMVYSPYQHFETLYDPRQGLCNGTIFGELNKPFYGDGRSC